MIVYYRQGYDPEEVLDIISVRPARTLGPTSWLILKDSEGQGYDATELKSEDGVMVAYLPENW